MVFAVSGTSVLKWCQSEVVIVLYMCARVKWMIGDPLVLTMDDVVPQRLYSWRSWVQLRVEISGNSGRHEGGS